jgi:hypothetical protein
MVELYLHPPYAFMKNFTIYGLAQLVICRKRSLEQRLGEPQRSMDALVNKKVPL